MQTARIFVNATTNQTVNLTDVVSTANPNNTIVGVYVSGTLDGADVLTEVQNPVDGSWIVIEDLSWRAGATIPLPPAGTDGATYLVINWKFRFLLINAGASTSINLGMNWDN